MPLDQTTHPKIAMPMTAASVAQRRMGLKASIWSDEGGPSALVSNEFSRGGMAVQACQGNVSRKMLTDNVCRKHLSLN